MRSVTTSSRLAGVEAAVKVVPVAVITIFLAFINAAVAAARRPASVGAAIVVAGVSVIADLTALGLDHTISAALNLAAVRAVIAVVIVSVVAGLVAFIASFEVRAQQPIAAARHHAARCAAVVILGVSIITKLSPGDACR